MQQPAGVGRPAETLRGLSDHYDPDGQVNLPARLGALAGYGAAVVGLVGLGRVLGRGLPDRIDLGDVVLGGLATHKFTRLVSRSSVASPVRAPFTEFVDSEGASEHLERPHGTHGVRHTVGEVLTCPFCLGVWVSTAYVAGLALAPRATRVWAALFTVNAVSDVMQHVYNNQLGD